ncbi:MAG: Rne/Rng family ribonuclease [Clostridiales bacterium]|jgi:ribonuclease G|nr:Rne/Rng family ribonuclease [Clostridiales bacterium]
MKKIYIDTYPTRAAVAVVENGKLVEFLAEKERAPKLVGNIYKGRVVNTLQGMRAAFVDIGLAKNAYLDLDEPVFDLLKNDLDGESSYRPEPIKLSPGNVVMCQVVKEQFGAKGARVSPLISLPGRYVVIVPDGAIFSVSRKITDQARRAALAELIRVNAEPGIGFIARTVAEDASDEDIINDMRRLTALWRGIKADYERAPVRGLAYADGDLLIRTIRDVMTSDLDEIVVNNVQARDRIKELLHRCGLSPNIITVYDGNEYIFARCGILPQVKTMLDRRVNMDNGGYLIFDRTEALTVIDVNTGKFVGETDLQNTVFNMNMAAAEEIAAQIRLRNIGGIVIVDFIDMRRKECRDAVIAKLTECVSRDRVKTKVLGMTQLGLVEITRRKEYSVINDMFVEECPHCQGYGVVFVDEVLVMRVREALLRFFEKNSCNAVVITVNPALAKEMTEYNVFNREFVRGGSKTLYLKENSAFEINRFEIKNADSFSSDVLGTLLNL